MSIVKDLIVKCQALLPNGEQTDSILVEPKVIRIEPLGYRGASHAYEIIVKTHNTPPGRYIVRLQVVYNNKPQSNSEDVIVNVEH